MTDLLEPAPAAASVTGGVKWLRVAQAGCWAVVTGLLWQTAWLSDDAVITLRSAINWGHGYGPNFNITESVASYTHPLWFFLITVQGVLTGSWVYGMLYLGLTLASAAVAVLFVRTKNVWQLSLCVIPVLLGNTTVDWLGSALEGPLAALLLGAFAYATLDRQRASAGVLAGFLLLCRLDLILLIGPALVYTAYMLRHHRGPLLQLLGGFAAPVALWAAWAKVTYGYVLPSTFAAKTNSDIPLTQLLGRGLEYVDATVRYDPLIAIVVVLAVLLLVLGSTAVRLWVLGAVLYSAYVVIIGGDYLLGRFQLLPMFAVLLALTATVLPPPRTAALFWILPVVTLTLALSYTRVLDFSLSTAPRITKLYFQDERFWSLAGRSLDPLHAIQPRPSGPIRVDLPFMAQVAESWPRGQTFTGEVTVFCHGLGAYSWVQPPSVHIIDPCGLTDRLMASLPFQPDGFWKAGHFEREPPAGYRSAVRAGDPSLTADPALRERLERIWTRIRPPSR